MALAATVADLWAMYRLNPSDRNVREGRAYYSAGSPAPEQFPAELVLRDLGGVHGETAAPLILARYAVLRAWLLAGARTGPALLDHARAAALAHLTVTPETWLERPLLQRLLEHVPDGATHGGDDAALLLEIAAAAEGAGHIDSALAARTAAWSGEVRGLRLGSASELAAGIAAFLRRQGAAARAKDWERAADRLARAAGGWLPPSDS
jgi:uncharacterized membrane protein YedE/YeeE